MQPAILCFDFDGTLVDKQGKIHADDVIVLAENHNVHFVPATGRPLHAVQTAFHHNGLFQDRPIPFPMVLQNGAVLYQEDEVLLGVKPFSPDISQTIFDHIQKFTQITCLAFSPNRVHILFPNQAGLGMVRRFGLHTEPLTADQMQREFTKFTFVAQTPEPLQKFASQTTDLPLERSFSLPTVFELTPSGVDKGSGLQHLLEQLGWSAYDIIAAGDGENDLPLFNQAKRSFCAHGSPSHICAQADQVINFSKHGLFRPILRAISSDYSP